MTMTIGQSCVSLNIPKQEVQLEEAVEVLHRARSTQHKDTSKLIQGIPMGVLTNL